VTELKPQLIEIVREFREAFQLNQDDEWLHLAMFNEESEEYDKAKNVSETADALADCVFVSCGAIIDGFDEFNQCLFETITCADQDGVDLLHATQTVFTSNMSKLATLGNINSTRDKYAKLGVEVEFQPVNEFNYKSGFRVICSRTVTGNDGKEYPAGKLLKSTDYKEPDWGYLSDAS
jgi:hypothetical protein